MTLYQVNEHPGAIAAHLLDVLRRGERHLGLNDLKTLEETASAVLVLVRCSINGYASISVLPPELLCMIFQHALLPSDEDRKLQLNEEPRVLHEIARRLALTHVCQRWRRIMLDMAPLWNVINEPSSAACSEFLSRSRDSPLFVHLKYSERRPVGRELIPHGDRIRDLFLSVSANHRSTIPAGDPEFPFDAPNLECLTIATRCPPFDDRRPSLDLDAPRALFVGGTPRLRTLRLYNTCWVPAAPYACLTRLHISQGMPMTLLALLAFLARCAALEELVLVDVYIATSSASAVPFDHAVALPRLRRLDLRINYGRLSMRRVLQYVAFPTRGVEVRVSGAKALQALSDLRPFPALPFARGFNRLELDVAGDRIRVAVRAAGERAADESRLLLDLAEYTPGKLEQATYLLRSVVSLDAVVELRCRTRVEEGRSAPWLLPDADLASLKTFCYVDAGSGAVPKESELWEHRRALYVGALSHALKRAPALACLELWSADARLPERLALDTTAPSLKKLAFRFGGSVDTLPNLAPLREHIQDVVVEPYFCEPSSEDLGFDVD